MATRSADAPDDLLFAALAASCSGRTSARADAPTRVVVNGVELHYIEAGQGEPVILLHGGQGDYRAWAPQILVLKPHYRVISYSRRYHYPNDNPIAGTNHSALVDAEDLAALMAQLGLDIGPPRRHVVRRLHRPGLRHQTPRDGAQPRAGGTAHPSVGHRRRAWRGALSAVHVHRARARRARRLRRATPRRAMRILVDAFDGPGAFKKLPPENRTAIMSNARFFQALTASSDPYPNLSRERRQPARHADPDREGGRNRRAAQAGDGGSRARAAAGAARDHSRGPVTARLGRIPDSFNYAMLEFLGAASKSDKSPAGVR